MTKLPLILLHSPSPLEHSGGGIGSIFIPILQVNKMRLGAGMTILSRVPQTVAKPGLNPAWPGFLSSTPILLAFAVSFWSSVSSCLREVGLM